MKKDFISENEVIFNDMNVFGDNEEHYYNVKCYDGYAIGVSTYNNNNEPKYIKVTYPKLSAILDDRDRTSYILRYRGLYDLFARDIHFGDVMMSFGVISPIEVGNQCKWNDPCIDDYEDVEEAKERTFTIVSIGENNVLENEDDIILISDGSSEVEVTINEIIFI